ncbi:hypothetical protein L21TH_0602 [Caldisalinibacter kiritimatiensis]|uniref:Uncharacterized protein n=1 Tax=Caldisalinibacter kiritimatiensis TaxID=1304284 RepID=R1AVL9_9FIRM|nr:hypothetical protein L21TH_0602 [Caldisalinibacter kiritimatiensis]
MKLFNLNIQIKYSEPLWNSEKIVESYKTKIRKQIDLDNLVDTGVILIGEGLESSEDLRIVNAIKQDLMFRKKIKNYLTKEVGLDDSKVRLCWYDNMEPDYLEEIKSLLEYGVGNIICVYTNPGATDISNNVIAVNIKNRIELPEKVKIKVIDGFVYDTNLIYELKKKIEFINLQKWD